MCFPLALWVPLMKESLGREFVRQNTASGPGGVRGSVGFFIHPGLTGDPLGTRLWLSPQMKKRGCQLKKMGGWSRSSSCTCPSISTCQNPERPQRWCAVYNPLGVWVGKLRQTQRGGTSTRSLGWSVAELELEAVSGAFSSAP